MVAHLEDKQLRWLVAIAGRPPLESLAGPLPDELKPGDGGDVLRQRESRLKTEAKKERRLQAVRQKLEDGKSRIRALMEIEVTLKDGTRVKAFNGSKLWNPDEEFDAVHHTHLMTDESLSGAEIERLKVGCQEMANLRNVMLGAVNPLDWSRIYQQHVEQGQSVEEVAEQWLVAPETIARAVEEYAALLQKTQADPSDPSFLDLLREQPPVRDTEPLFSDLEIRRELFDPLVREKVLPDNETEDRFNTTYQVFGGASEEYKAALKTFSAGAEEDPELTNLRERTNKGIKSVVKIGSELVGILGKLSDAEEVVAATSLASDVLKISEQVGLLAATTVDQYYGKQAEGLVDQVGGALEVVLKATLGREAAEYAKWARAGYTSLVNAKDISAALLKREQGWVDQALEQLAGGLENALSIGGNENASRVGKGLKHALLLKVNTSKVLDYLRQDPPAVELVVATIGKAATAAFKDVLGDSLVSDKSPSVRETSRGGTTAGETPAQGPSEGPSEDETKKEAEDEYNEALDELAGDLDSSLGEAIKSIEESRQPAAELQRELANPEALRSLTAKLQEDATKRLAASIEEELKALPGKDAPGEDEDIEREFIAIQPLIADVRKSGVYLKLADSLLDAGLKAAAQFVAVAKVASAGKDLLKTMVVAYGKKRQLHQWTMLRQDALAAASITSSSFSAKIKDLDMEFSEHRYKALLSLADTLGSSLSTIIDPSGVAGEVISKSASAGNALLDIVLEGRKASDLSRAWQAYLEALRNPGDRIKLRDAIQKNSTLAKYALAYAALHDGDRLAKAGLAQVGLTEEVLLDPSAKVADVVTYLESVWASDPTNMKKVYLPGDWQADSSGDLTFEAWMANMHAARGDKLGDDKLDIGDTGAVEGALLGLQETRDARGEAARQVQLAADRAADLSDEYATAHNAYTTSSAMCDGLRAELQTLQKQATAARRELKLAGQQESWADMAQRADALKTHLETLVKLKLDRTLEDILQRIQEFESAANKCAGVATGFLSQSEQHVRALEQLPTRQQAVADTLKALQKSLRSCKPQRADGKPCQAVTLYVQSMVNATNDALRVEQAEQGNHEQQLADLRLRRSGAEAFPGEMAAKRKTLARLRTQTERFQTQYREYFLACKKEWDDARPSAGV